MFIATGVLVLKQWEHAVFKIFSILIGENRETALWKGSLSIVNGVLFLIDALLTFRD